MIGASRLSLPCTNSDCGVEPARGVFRREINTRAGAAAAAGSAGSEHEQNSPRRSTIVLADEPPLPRTANLVASTK